MIARSMVFGFKTTEQPTKCIVRRAGELPSRGPRGGVIWPPRYFVRRVAWHLLDHLWEIEDRAR